MRNFLLVGLMAAATLLMSADAVFAGGDSILNKDKSKGHHNSSIKFTYPVVTTEVQPDLVVLVRSAEAGPPTTVGDLKAAVGVEPGGQYIAKDLKPGSYSVWLGLASSLEQLAGVADNTPVTEDQLNAFVIDTHDYTLEAGQELPVIISPDGMTLAPATGMTTLPAGNAN